MSRRIIIKIEDSKTAAELKDGQTTVVWEDLSRDGQIDMLNAIVDIYKLFHHFLKEE